MHNATQSNTLVNGRCHGNKCTADKAIDGDKATYSYTKYWRDSASWSVELSSTVNIKKILFTTSDISLMKGYFNRFKVETRVISSEPWKICRGEYLVKGSPTLLIAQCQNETIAGHLRLSVSGMRVQLILGEVKVIGSVAGNFSCKHNFRNNTLEDFRRYT